MFSLRYSYLSDASKPTRIIRCRICHGLPWNYNQLCNFTRQIWSKITQFVRKFLKLKYRFAERKIFFPPLTRGGGACKGAIKPIKETALRMPGPPLPTQASQVNECRRCKENINIGRRKCKHSRMCLCMEWLTTHSKPTHLHSYPTEDAFYC